MGDDDYEKRKLNESCAKGRTSINCWHINDEDSVKMWDSYTSSPESILVRTTVKNLQTALKMPVMGAGVKYVAEDAPKTDFGNRSLFYYKDEQYEYEKEYRLLVDLNSLEEKEIQMNLEEDFYRMVPVDLETLIIDITCHPSATPDTRRLLSMAQHEAALQNHIKNS